MTTYRLMDGVSGRPGTGSSGTQPPAAGQSYSGNYLAGNVFQVTSGGLYFQGYWWYVPATVTDTSGWKFALWQVGNFSGYYGTLIPGSTVTGGTLTAGAWNYIPVTIPLPLTANVPYEAVTGKVVATGLPATLNQFNTGDPYPSGVTNGPLTMHPTGDAFMTPLSLPQMPFATSASDPAAAFPATNDHDDNLWLDIQVTDVAPGGSTYRAWPSMGIPYPPIITANDQTGYTLGMEFSLSQNCTLQKIWHYSPTGVAGDGGHVATVLPSRCGIWDVGSQTEVAGTDNSSPSWLLPAGGAASAGAGWVYCDYSSSGVTLSASTNYKVSTYYGAGADWFGSVENIYGSGNFQGSGFTNGPLTIPNDAGASPGQQSWNTVSWAYPATSTNPEADYVDVEVAPAAAPSSGPAYTAYMSSM